MTGARRHGGWGRAVTPDRVLLVWPRRALRPGPWVLAASVLAASVLLVSCGGGGSGSGASSSSPDARLARADATVQAAASRYLHAAHACTTASSPVVCLEKADLAFGDAVHRYANVLASGQGFGAPRHDLTTARDRAQTLANSLEILGDAQPTQANYNQVLNNFDLPHAISRFQQAVSELDHALG